MAETPKQKLIEAIRGWIHMDNLVESFNQQATNARNLRNKHEQDSIRLMKELGLSASTIQVSGASLNIQKKKVPTGLSWTYLEKEIPAWATRSGIPANQSAALVKWLHEHRESKEVESLKKCELA
jgi:hypothetical protein